MQTTPVYHNARYRIKRNTAYQAMMLKLIKENIFDQYMNILMMSAVIGLRYDCPIPLTRRLTEGDPRKEGESGHKKAVDTVQMTVVDDDRYFAMFDLIAYAVSNSLDVVNSDAKYEIFESYANGGFPKLLELLDIDENTIFTEDRKMETIDKLFRLFKTEKKPPVNSIKPEDILID